MIRKRLRENILLSDYDTIVSLVPTKSKVLDLGCGVGDLLIRLKEEKEVQGMGLEINQTAVIECIHKGLSVVQGNIDQGLVDYSDNSYDYVILNKTLQVIHKPDFVIEEMLRVGKQAIVSFPNFGYWQVRLSFLLKGNMPRTIKLPFEWYNTPNIHLVTIKDFKVFCKTRKIEILKQINLASNNKGKPKQIKHIPNWRADEGIFIITRR